MTGTKTALGIIQLSFNYFLASFRWSGLRKCPPWQPTFWQTCSAGKFPAITTPIFTHNATETQSSCLQRTGEAL